MGGGEFGRELLSRVGSHDLSAAARKDGGPSVGMTYEVTLWSVRCDLAVQSRHKCLG